MAQWVTSATQQGHRKGNSRWPWVARCPQAQGCKLERRLQVTQAQPWQGPRCHHQTEATRAGPGGDTPWLGTRWQRGSRGGLSGDMGGGTSTWSHNGHDTGTQVALLQVLGAPPGRPVTSGTGQGAGGGSRGAPWGLGGAGGCAWRSRRAQVQLRRPATASGGLRGGGQGHRLLRGLRRAPSIKWSPGTVTGPSR